MFIPPLGFDATCCIKPQKTIYVDENLDWVFCCTFAQIAAVFMVLCVYRQKVSYNYLYNASTFKNGEGVGIFDQIPLYFNLNICLSPQLWTSDNAAEEGDAGEGGEGGENES